MSRFSPFRAVRYDDAGGADDGVVDLSTVIAPLTALRNEADRSPAAERDPYNVARLLDPHDGGARWSRWADEAVLRLDDDPALYLYRIGTRSPAGSPVQVSGVVGLGPPVDDPTPVQAIEVAPISVDAPGFTHLLQPPGAPVARATDNAGNHHRLWRITQRGVIDAIGDAVASHGPSPLPAGLVFAVEAGTPQAPPAIGMLFLERTEDRRTGTSL